MLYSDPDLWILAHVSTKLGFEPGYSILGNYIIGTLLEQNAQIRNLPFNQVFDPEVGICFQSPDPVNKLSGCRLLLDAFDFPEAVECSDGAIKQVFVDTREMNLHNSSHHVGFRKGDVVKIAATQKWIGEIFFSVGGNNNDGPAFCANGFIDLDDVELHLVQHIEHIVLKIGVGLIDLVNQQNHSFFGYKGLSDLPHPNIIFDIAHIPFGVSKAAII